MELTVKIVALGANLPSDFGTPVQTLAAAVRAIKEKGIVITSYSRIWKTAPVPFHPDHPWYHNAVIAVQTDKSAHDLLRALLEIEQDFGRVRTVKNAPRLLDLDLIAYDDQIVPEGPDIIVPHPRMQVRAFVLLPLYDIAQDWVHPQSGASIQSLISALPLDQQAQATDEVWHD
jgi:2-amino-4-hydroxy-6-hydroxymethyldihydropteridine diphosphokinase